MRHSTPVTHVQMPALCTYFVALRDLHCSAFAYLSVSCLKGDFILTHCLASCCLYCMPSACQVHAKRMPEYSPVRIALSTLLKKSMRAACPLLKGIDACGCNSTSISLTLYVGGLIRL